MILSVVQVVLSAATLIFLVVAYRNYRFKGRSVFIISFGVKELVTISTNAVIVTSAKIQEGLRFIIHNHVARLETCELFCISCGVFERLRHMELLSKKASSFRKRLCDGPHSTLASRGVGSSVIYIIC